MWSVRQNRHARTDRKYAILSLAGSQNLCQTIIHISHCISHMSRKQQTPLPLDCHGTQCYQFLISLWPLRNNDLEVEWILTNTFLLNCVQSIIQVIIHAITLLITWNNSFDDTKRNVPLTYLYTSLSGLEEYCTRLSNYTWIISTFLAIFRIVPGLVGGWY